MAPVTESRHLESVYRCLDRILIQSLSLAVAAGIPDPAVQMKIEV